MTKAKNKIGIIGAGPAGSLSAILLKRAGHEVILIDSKTQVKRKVCGEYLCPTGVDLLKRVNLFHLIEYFEPVYGMKIVSPKLKSLLSFFPKYQGKEKTGVSVNRKLFDGSLRQEAIALGVDGYFGEKLEELKKDNDLWIVKTNKSTYKVNLLLACDGINSRVAQLLGHKIKIKSNRLALHCYLKFKDIKQYSRLGQMHIFKDGSYCGIDPINENEINFSIVCHKKMIQGKKLYEVINHYISQSEILSSSFDLIDEDQKVTTLGKIKNKNKFIAGENLAYIGDSSGFIDPLTGEGIYNALYGAELLSNSIDFQNIEKSLKEYKKKKKEIFREKNLVNNIFQYVIKLPFLCELIAKFLSKKQERANTFIGIIGNIYRPIEGLKKLFL
jgi:flavin-dependent dehydrogenase